MNEPIDEALRNALRLTLTPGVGPRLWRRLVDRFGSPEAAFQAAPSELRDVEGVGTKVAQAVARAAEQVDVDAELACCREHGVSLRVSGRPDYPDLLQQIYDPPPVLYVRGNLLPQDGLAVAIVGTRHPTAYGLRQAERLAGSLARAGLTIVSGLARGIDAAAHRGALAAGGRTLAVLASGVMNVYPPEHDRLATDVIAQGALLSEAACLAAPVGGMFPQRNRIISGLSLGVLVIEAGDRSGALITARQAMEHGRDVFAVPGRIEDRTSRGCHRLLRDGAKLVETAEDILEELGPLCFPTTLPDSQQSDGQQVVHRPCELLLSDVEKEVLAAMSAESISIDEVIANTQLSAAQVLATLNVLEMRHLIRRQGGSRVVRV